MSKVAILTDSNSGITQAAGKELGVSVLPMPFYINDELFYEDITLSQEQFYEHLEADAEIHTSMPVVGDVLDRWKELLETHDEVVYIPMSSGLSSSCITAKTLAEDFDGRVQVVDNQRISVTQRQSVLDAQALAAQGWGAAQIREYLEKTKFESSIYIYVPSLKYLRKGGRVTAAAAAMGTLLRIKPVLGHGVDGGDRPDLSGKEDCDAAAVPVHLLSYRPGMPCGYLYKEDSRESG